MLATILCVEADHDLSDLLAFILRRDGFHVHLTSSGVQLWPLVRAYAADLVVLDLDQPHGTAEDRLAALAALRVHTALPVLLTGHAPDAVVVRGFALGADDYLAKPYRFPVLVARVRNLLRRTVQAPHRPLKPIGHADLYMLDDGIRFDAVRQTVTEGEARLRLTPLESRLLHALCRQAGHPLAADQLWERVQAHDRASDPRGVRTHIRHLRTKLARLPSRPQPIQTVPGRGYLVATARRAQLSAD